MGSPTRMTCDSICSFCALTLTTLLAYAWGLTPVKMKYIRSTPGQDVQPGQNCSLNFGGQLSYNFSYVNRHVSQQRKTAFLKLMLWAHSFWAKKQTFCQLSQPVSEHCAYSPLYHPSEEFNSFSFFKKVYLVYTFFLHLWTQSFPFQRLCFCIPKLYFGGSEVYHHLWQLLQKLSWYNHRD